MGTDRQDEIEMVCRAKVDAEDWVFIRVRAGGVILGVLILNSLNYFCPKSGLGPERSGRASSCWKRRGTMERTRTVGGSLFWPAFKKNH